MTSPDNEAKIMQALGELASTQKKHLNRLVACEALLQALVMRVDPPALPGILEEFEAALDRSAADIPPRLQMPELWQEWTTLLSDRLRSLEQAPPRNTGAA